MGAQFTEEQQKRILNVAKVKGFLQKVVEP